MWESDRWKAGAYLERCCCHPKSPSCSAGSCHSYQAMMQVEIRLVRREESKELLSSSPLYFPPCPKLCCNACTGWWQFASLNFVICTGTQMVKNWKLGCACKDSLTPAGARLCHCLSLRLQNVNLPKLTLSLQLRRHQHAAQEHPPCDS